MPADRYIEHLTLATGHSRRSYRREVSDEAVAYCRDLLDQAIAGEDDGLRVPIAGIGCDLGVIAQSRSILCSIARDGHLLVTVGIATHSRAGASLWRVLTRTGHPVLHPSINPERCPPEPWCVARLEAGSIGLDGDTLMALANVERCLAWGFIERAERLQ